MKIDRRTLRMAFFWFWWEVKNLGKDKIMLIKKGEIFPFGDLKTVKGETVALTGPEMGVFYFYPKDDTPGCTIEAKQFTLLEKDFAAKGVQLFGVSADGPESHRAFCDKFGIRFPLLIDEGGRVGQKIGNWRGVNHARTTLLVESSGKVIELWDAVKAEGHAQAVLDALNRV